MRRNWARPQLSLLVLTAAALVLCARSASAQAPIPRLLEQGKTVYLVNAAAHQKHFDDLARYLGAWGRFTLVNSRAGADLVFTFASSSGTSGSAVAVPVGSSVVAVGGARRSYVLSMSSAGDPDPVHLDAEELGLGRNAI